MPNLFESLAQRFALGLGFLLHSKDVVEPQVEQIIQSVWAADPTRLLDPQTAAELVSQHLFTPGEGAHEAAGGGLAGDRFAQLVALSHTQPDLNELRAMFRRGTINAEQYEYALRRAGLEAQWHEATRELNEDRLTPADVANAIQQGFLHNPGILPTSPPTKPGEVPTRPPVDLDPLEESAAWGIDKDRLTVLARLAGLPPGPMELLEMVRRGIITEDDFRRGVAEGHTKTEWADAYLAMLRRPLYASELAAQVVKEYMTLPEAQRLAERAGISAETLADIVNTTGRPPGPAQLQTALNRGLIDRARFRHGIAQSDVKTEWVDVLAALRVRYPTAFALRQLLSSGAIEWGEGSRILQLQGWEPALADKVAHAWADGKAARVKELAEGQVATLYEARYIDRGQAASMLESLGYPEQATNYLLELADARRVTKFLNIAVGRLHTLFVGHRLSEQDAVVKLGELGVSTEATDDLLATWKLERDVARPVVTPAQIAGAVYYGIIPRVQGIAMLRDRGYSETDANLVIDVRLHGHPEPAGGPTPAAPGGTL